MDSNKNIPRRGAEPQSKSAKTASQSKAPLVPQVVEPTALTVKSSRMPAIKGKTPGQRINFLHRLSVASGKLSIAAGIMAGWELRMVKDKLEHGQWLDWLAANTAISPVTAQRYMSVYSQTIGAARAALPEPVPLKTRPSLAELDEAAANVDAPTLNGLYKQLKILKGNPDHGGKRENAGRKTKGEDVAAALDAVAQNAALLWVSAKGALDTLVQLDSTRDVFHRLSNESLAIAAGLLADLSQHAADALAQRFDGSHNIQETTK